MKLACLTLIYAAVALIGTPGEAATNTVTKAIRLASVTYGVDYGDMRSVAWCESRLNPHAQNPHSSARGLFQFLDTTWAHTPYRSFSRDDPHANALAAGWVVRKDHGWREWQCRP